MLGVFGRSSHSFVLDMLDSQAYIVIYNTEVKQEGSLSASFLFDFQVFAKLLKYYQML